MLDPTDLYTRTIPRWRGGGGGGGGGGLWAGKGG